MISVALGTTPYGPYEKNWEIYSGNVTELSKHEKGEDNSVSRLILFMNK